MSKRIPIPVQSGYNVSIVEDDSVFECIVKSRSEALRLTRDAELRGCIAWRITYLTDSYIQKFQQYA